MNEISQFVQDQEVDDDKGLNRFTEMPKRSKPLESDNKMVNL